MNPRISIKSLVDGWLEVNRPTAIGREEFAQLRDHVNKRLAGARRLSPRYLLELLLATDLEIDRSLGGIPLEFRGRVHVSDFRRAAHSLIEMTTAYAAARGSGAEERVGDCRRAVMLAKDRLHLHLARKNLSPETREEKQELLEWFVVWLESPEVFPDWITLRRKQLAANRLPDQPPLI